MNNKLIVGAVAVLVIAAGAYFFTSKKGGVGDGGMFQNSSESETSIKELLASGQKVSCTFDSSVENSASSGTVYVANGHMRGDFTSQAQSGAVESHMISDGTDMYVWSSAMPQGIKMRVDAKPTTAQNNDQPVSYDSKVKYNCKPWTPETQSFELPAGVTFTDMSAMMGGAGMPMGGDGGTQSSASMKAQQCAACEALSGDQKAQCKLALQCQ